MIGNEILSKIAHEAARLERHTDTDVIRFAELVGLLLEDHRILRKEKEAATGGDNEPQPEKLD